MNIDEAVKILGLEKCSFSDVCDTCAEPSGPSYVSVCHCDGVSEVGYYACSACAVKRAEEAVLAADCRK